VQIQSIADRPATVSRLLVVAEEGAQVDVVEDHRGGEGGKVVSISEVLVGAHARVRHVVLQRWANDTRGHQTFRSRLGAGAELQTVVASLGGQVVKVDVGAELAGRDSRSNLAGVAIGSGSQHLDYHTVHHHSAPNTSSNIDFKVAVSDQAESAYTGRIEIEKQARGSRAYQENRNLLLSADSRAETIPELEILTDDVECSHGATLSPVDPLQLFYLQSRGLSPEGALALYLAGFVTQPLAGLPEGLRENVSEVVRDVVRDVAARAPQPLPVVERAS
jgi:Fe-S cluster assembly protein SufD